MLLQQKLIFLCELCLELALISNSVKDKVYVGTGNDVMVSIYGQYTVECWTHPLRQSSVASITGVT